MPWCPLILRRSCLKAIIYPGSFRSCSPGQRRRLANSSNPDVNSLARFTPFRSWLPRCRRSQAIISKCHRNPSRCHQDIPNIFLNVTTSFLSLTRFSSEDHKIIPEQAGMISEPPDLSSELPDMTLDHSNIILEHSKIIFEYSEIASEQHRFFIWSSWAH